MFEYPVVDISETESKAFSEIAAPKNASAKKSSKPELIKRVQFARTVEVFKISPVKLADVSDDHHAFCFAQLESDSDESVSNDEEFADCPSPVIPGKSSPVTPKVDASVNEIVQGRIKVRLFSENGEYEGEQDNPCISSPQSLNQMDPEDGFVSFSQLSLLFDETFNSQPKSFTNVCNETSEKVVCHSEYLRGNEDNAQQSKLNESQLPAPELEEVEPGHRSGEDTPDVEVSERPAVDSVHSRRLELCVADDDVDNGSTKIDKIESFEINEVGIDEGTNSPTIDNEKCQFLCLHSIAADESKESYEKNVKLLQDLEESESDSHKLLPPVESEKPAFVGFRTAAGKTVSYSKESEEKSRKLLQDLDETESDSHKLLPSVESEKPAFVGFRTAAGKTVSYSKESEEKSRKLLQDLDETESDSHKLLPPVESEKPAFVGFRTAAGKTVSYSKESEEKSRKLLQDLDETESDSHKLLPPVESEKPAFVGFRTAAGKTVSYSKESEEKSRKLLQDLDETESEQNSKCSSRGESKKRVLVVSCAEDTLERRAVKQDSKESIENELVGLPKLTDHDSIGLKTPLVVEPPFSVRGKLIAGMTPENLKNINSVPFEPKPCVHTPFPSKNSHPPNKELFFNDEAKPSTVISSFGTASSNTSQPAYQLRSRSKSSKTFKKPRCLFEIDEKDSITSKKDENSTSVAEKGSAAKNAKTSCESNTSKSVAGKRGSTSKFKSPVIADKLVHGTHLKINLKESTNSTESTAISNKMGRILNIRTQCLMKLAFEDLAVINDHRTSNARMACTKVYCIAKNVVSGYNFTFGVDEFFSPKAVSTGIVYIGDNAELNIKGKKTIGPLDFHRAMLTIPGELLSWNQKQIRNT